jgi:3-hydroxyisobutyrate dehydrogenase-like beta-hydroxyacid dehydrogenase
MHIGFIGLGQMGRAIVGHLLSAGHQKTRPVGEKAENANVVGAARRAGL